MLKNLMTGILIQLFFLINNSYATSLEWHTTSSEAIKSASATNRNIIGVFDSNTYLLTDTLNSMNQQSKQRFNADFVLLHINVDGDPESASNLGVNDSNTLVLYNPTGNKAQILDRNALLYKYEFYGHSDGPFYSKRVEPKSGKVIHGVGQYKRYYAGYIESAGKDLSPSTIILYMEGEKLHNPEAFLQWCNNTGEKNGMPEFFIPQIGIGLHNVASGETDKDIDKLVLALKKFKRPVFLRLGYEFNGSWTKYKPEEYIIAWKRFSHKIRQANLSHVALVWCYYPHEGGDGNPNDYMRYYPGDEHVDWWGIDLFNIGQFESKATKAYLRDARIRGFPVMIGESTPSKLDINSRSTWLKWFVPYFNLIEKNPHIKAFCYISDDWRTREFGLNDWGDCRIHLSSYWLNYKTKLSNPRFLHGGATEEFYKQSGIQKP